ncbi:MAG: hypothetical protein HQ592_13165 [Planctomycetes bacterium]|nr:hypothetical protein [Planctomycetota bacterium]
MRNLMINTTARIRQRGSVIIILAVSILAVMAFAALVVDLGAVHTARTQLKVATDAAALAAVQELGGDQVYATAAQFASLNSVLARPVTLSQEDIVTGHLDFATGAFTPDAEPPNAVRVTARRTPGSPDGPLDLFFAGVFGIDTVSLEAESVAALDGRVGGVEPAQTENELDLLPFAVDLDQVGHLEDLEGNAIDAVNFEIELDRSETRFVANVDQTIDFFPFDDMEAPGNFGLVSLDGHSNGTSVLRNWIDNGYPDTFSISSDPGYLLLNGCPGMHGGISNAIDARVGDTVLVTVYDNLTGQGNNATYRIPYFLAVEIVDVQLTGPPESRHIEAIIKGFHTTNLIIDPSAPEHSAIGINRLGG